MRRMVRAAPSKAQLEQSVDQKHCSRSRWTRSVDILSPTIATTRSTSSGSTRSTAALNENMYLLLVAYGTILVSELIGDKSIYTISSLTMRFHSLYVFCGFTA